MSEELYPQGAPTLEKHDGLLYRHARSLAYGVQQDVAMNERHAQLSARFERSEEKAETWRERIDAELSAQTAKLNQILLALKVLGGIATPALTAGVIALISYMIKH